MTVPAGQRFKLGRTMGRKIPAGTLMVRDYLADPLPVDNESPDDNTFAITNWEMLGNDQWGDCVVAADIHMCMVHAVAAGLETVENGTVTGTWPATQDALNAYWACQIANGATGPQPDNGLDEYQWFLWRLDNGIGKLSDGSWIIPPHVCFGQLPDGGNEFASGIRLFYAAFAAILVSNEAMAQAEQNPPAEWNGTQTDWLGGHGVPIVMRNTEEGELPTWGFTQKFTWPWWNSAKEGTYAVVSAFLADTRLVSTINVAQLEADDRALGTGDGNGP